MDQSAHPASPTNHRIRTRSRTHVVLNTPESAWAHVCTYAKHTPPRCRRAARPSVRRHTIRLNIIHRAPSTHPPSVRDTLVQQAHTRGACKWMMMMPHCRETVDTTHTTHTHERVSEPQREHVVRYDRPHLLLFCYFYVVDLMLFFFCVASLHSALSLPLGRRLSFAPPSPSTHLLHNNCRSVPPPVRCVHRLSTRANA